MLIVMISNREQKSGRTFINAMITVALVKKRFQSDCLTGEQHGPMQQPQPHDSAAY